MLESDQLKNPVDVYFNWIIPASKHKLYWERISPAGVTDEFHLKVMIRY